MGDQAYVRSRMYAALALAFRKPELASEEGEHSLTQTLQQVAACLGVGALGEIADELARSLEAPEEPDFPEETQFLQALEVEYNRLFVGPGRPEAPPYESVYRDPRGQVLGAATQDVVQKYAEAGLAPEPDHHDLPDHVATELGFMAYLALRESGSWGTDVSTWSERARTFLQEHLAAWLPAFCVRVLNESRHPFYVALARLTGTVVSLDMQRLA